MEKNELRRQMLQARDRLTAAERRHLSQRIMERLWQWELFRQADGILSYASFRSEVETDLLNERIIREGKTLYLPRTEPDMHRMVFYPVNRMNELISGYQGIREPQKGEAPFCGVKRTETIVMLMPGVAFDEKRNRIGYGGGYYDRYLSQYRAEITCTCMLAFECQRLEKIEEEPCDIRPDRILTEWR